MEVFLYFLCIKAENYGFKNTETSLHNARLIQMLILE